jgi:hypothetical protein
MLRPDEPKLPAPAQPGKNEDGRGGPPQRDVGAAGIYSNRYTLYVRGCCNTSKMVVSPFT